MNALLEAITKISLVKKLGGLVLVVILMGAGYYFLFYQDLSTRLEGLHAENVRLQKQKADATRRKDTYDRDRHRRDELRKSYAQQLRALPQDAEMSSFLNSLNAQAELVGLEIQSVKPLNEQAAQYYARIPVQLRLKGNYLQLAKFFYLVGNVDRIINIENITFKVDELDESGVQLDANVLATTFRALESSKTAKAPAGKKAKKG
jgi:type IV pilus assembly protein PilO